MLNSSPSWIMRIRAGDHGFELVDGKIAGVHNFCGAASQSLQLIPFVMDGVKKQRFRRGHRMQSARLTVTPLQDLGRGFQKDNFKTVTGILQKIERSCHSL